MKKLLKSAVAVVIASTLAACSSSTSTEALNENIPEWVLSPSIEDGIAHSECVPSSGNMSIDKAQAIALARVGLAQQISTKVKALDKTYQDRVDVEGETVTGSTFSSVSKQLTNQMLVGAQPVKTSYANFNGKNQLCVMTALSPEKTKDLFSKLVSASERKLSPQDESVLYQEFKAYKAQQELDKELMKDGNP